MIKKEKDVFNKDLSGVKGSYTKELGDHMQEINTKFADSSIDANGYRAFIVKAIEKAHDTPAKRNFLLNLSKKRTKYDMLFYATNSYLNGSKLGVI